MAYEYGPDFWALLTSLCDTLVPCLSESDELSEPVRSFMERKASDAGVPAALQTAIANSATHVHAAIRLALESLGADFADQSSGERRRRWLSTYESRATHFGAFVLRTTICSIFYTIADSGGRGNPSWPAIGFSGPVEDPPSPAEQPKTLQVHPVSGEHCELRADVIVVGSGAAGGVVAARLAATGKKVLVLERGGYNTESDFIQSEALAGPRLYLDGGYMWSASGSLALLAGSTVGGGTTVNSMACMATPPHVLREWSAAGMNGVEPGEFEYHIDSIRKRINAFADNTRHNANNRVLIRGLSSLGLPYEVLARDASPDDDDRLCGLCNSGCLRGAKQSTMKTYLQDASDCGAHLVANCTVRKVTVKDGRVTGVEAEVRNADQSTTRLTVAAPAVVLAAGAIGTPMLLQQSGLGGPAVGQHLHVHPSYFVSGVFDETIRGWVGQILTSVCTEFQLAHGDTGFVIEAAPLNIGFWTGLTGWNSGRQHKTDQLRLQRVAGVWGFLRDHGEGSVSADGSGRPHVDWDLDDDVDLQMVRRCHVELARILRAAGAREIFTFLPGDPRWVAGEDFDAFLDRLSGLASDEIFTLSAHQTGTCRTGTDPMTSVVDGYGRVHGVPGLWVADASALPTAPGVNPMISIQAFAARTAGYICDSVPGS